jgi:hypothetical protein
VFLRCETIKSLERPNCSRQARGKWESQKDEVNKQTTEKSLPPGFPWLVTENLGFTSQKDCRHRQIVHQNRLQSITEGLSPEDLPRPHKPIRAQGMLEQQRVDGLSRIHWYIAITATLNCTAKAELITAHLIPKQRKSPPVNQQATSLTAFYQRRQGTSAGLRSGLSKLLIKNQAM